MEIDVKTLFYLFTVSNIFILILFAAYVFLYKIKFPILNLFISSRILGVIAISFLSLRGLIPDFFSITLFNIFIFFTLFFEVYFISFVDGSFNSKHFKRAILIPLLSSVAFLVFINFPEKIRILIVSLGFVVILAFGASNLIFNKTKTKIQQFAGYLFSIASILFLLRFVIVFLDDNILLHSTSVIQVISYIYLFLLIFLIPIIFLFIIKEMDTKIIKDDIIKLQELNKSKDKLFSIIGHDLRGPISGLQQLSEILWKRENEPIQMNKLLKALYESSKNTFNLLDNLLNWSIVKSGEMAFNPERISLNKIINQNIDLFKLQSTTKNIILTNKIEGELYIFMQIIT